VVEARDEIREQVRALCRNFPGEYWREKDRARDYPAEFVAALTEGGWLACLVPEAGAKITPPKSIELIPVSTLWEAIRVGLVRGKENP